MTKNRSLAALALLATLFLSSTGVEGRPPAGDAVADFKAWFREYKKGKIDLYQPSAVPRTDASDPSLRYVRTEAVRRMDDLLDALATRNDRAAARLLVEAATFRFSRRPEVEIRKHYKQQPWMLRSHAREALRRIRDPDARKWLEFKLVKTSGGWEDPFLKVLALSVLGDGREQDEHGLALRLLDDPDPRVRERALSKLGRVGDVTDLDRITPYAQDKDDRVRVAALEATRHILERAAKRDPAFAESGLALAYHALEDPSWAVEEAALDMLEHFRSRRSIPVLLDHLARLADRSGKGRERVRQHTTAVLRSLTGAFILEPNPARWRGWWEQNRDHFVLSPAPKSELKGFQLDLPYFFNIPVDTDAVCFILDISGSMSAPLPGQEGGKDTPVTKLDRAREEMDRALSAMDPAVRFNIVLFNDEVHPFRPGPVPAEEENRSAASKFYGEVPAEGGTNIFDALNSILRFQSMGLVDRFSDRQEYDTVFLLSDGVPTTGIVIDPSEIVRIVSDANRHSRIRINTIYVGAGRGSFMQELAENNFGTFVHVR